MVDLISPGVQVQVIDESPYVSSGPGTVPLIILATSQDKVNPSGTGIATGTLKSEANKVKLITSQRELIQTFGEPTFYTSQGTPLHGYELNEYGLLAAYSYLGIANRAFVLRGDIDLKQLAASTSSPRNKARNGTYWFDLGASKFGVFASNGRSVPGSAWESRNVRVIEKEEELQNNLTGVVPRPTNAVPIIIGSAGVLKINGINVNLLLNDNLSDVVAAVNAADIPNIEAIAYRLGEKSYLTIVNTIGGEIDLIGSDTSILIDLGLSTAQSYITPKTSLGNIGDFSAYVLQNDNQIYQKLIAKTFLGRIDDSAQAWWYRVGSEDWKKADPTVSIGTTNPPLTGPGDTFFINGEAITLSGTTVLSAVSDINSNVNLQAQFITAREFQGRLYITNEPGGNITITDGPGNPATELGVRSLKGKNLYYAPHTRYPSGSVRGDVWIRTTTPNNGANYVVKRYSSSTDTWTVVDTPWFTHGVRTSAVAEAYLNPTSVDSIVVTAGGNGYTSAPIVNFVGGGGSGATANSYLGYSVASVSILGSISGATVTNGGSGYTSVPTITFSGGGGGSGAAASAVLAGLNASINNGGSSYVVGDTLTIVGGTFGTSMELEVTGETGGVITGVSIITPGDYTVAPTNPVSVTGGSGSSATFNLSYEVSSITIDDSGSGYTTTPTISITSGGGSGAAASAIVNYGGTGWSGTPIVTFSGGGGTDASAVATVGYEINSLNLVNGGTGYTSSPSVTFVGGNGTGASGTAIIGKTISNITTVAGTGYTSPPSVVFTGGDPTVSSVGTAVMKAVSATIASGGTGYNIGEVITCSGGISPVFMQVAATSSGVITAANIISAGSYLTISPTLTQVTSNGSGVGATFNITWGVGSIQFTPGQGYETVPAVSFSGGGGTGASATAFLSSTGSVKSVILTNNGSGYTTAPAVVFTGGGGTGAVFAAVLNPTGSIKAITVVSGGAGYNSPPTVTITGAGSGEIPVANLSATGSVTSVVVTNPGLGYTGNTTITFTGGSGSGAAATAVLQPTTVGGILLQSPGGWYSAVPDVNIVGGGGSDATAVATISNLGGVATVQLTDGGTNYTSVPTVEFVTSQTSVIRLAEADRNALLTLDPTGDGMVSGVIYVAYNIEALSANDGLTSQIMRRWNGTEWEDLSYEASITVPNTPPSAGALWYNTNFRVDVMVNDGDQWFGYQNFYPTTDPLGVLLNGSEPLTQTDGTPLVQGDLWIDTTDLENYPKLYRFDATFGRWELVDKTDQTTPFGIVFADARWNADGTENGSEYIAALLNTNYVDPDAPDPRTYPSGMLLFNTRYSFGNVKEWRPDWFKSGPVDVSFDANTDYRDFEYNIGIQTFDPLEYPGRWVSVSGNKIDGSPYMLRKAQRRMVVRALQAAVNANQDIRSEDRFFNLIATPGYVELIDEMFTLNVDKKEWAFIIGDTPLRLPPDGTSITDWALNRNMSPTNDEDGLATAYYNLALYYPWGYTSDLRGNDVVVPPSHIALRTYAYNDSIAYPWFAPAGFTRGLVSNATTVGYLTSEDEFRPVFLNQGQRDVLYSTDVRINPIAFIPGRGLVVYGQRTRHPLQTALDRVNVARLICYMRYQLDTLMKPFLFEPNDQQTRDVVKLVTDRFLSELLSKRALYDYLTVCDETNNTPARIDRNELWVDIAIQPVKVIEFIYVPIRIVNTGVALS